MMDGREGMVMGLEGKRERRVLRCNEVDVMFPDEYLRAGLPGLVRLNQMIPTGDENI